MTTMPVQRGFVVTSGLGARWGTTHWGTDYGLDGGSGGKPIFAIKDGTAVQVGPASGFGQWIRLDHAANVGGGESVYGHIIPEISTGQFVREGQRIGRINPDSSTNGGVAPHLHLEFYARSWVGAAQRIIGQTILNPEDVLRGALWPGENTPQGGKMTIFGVDVSEHQNGMSMARAAAEGMKFAIIRTTDGTYKDRCYRSHLEDAEGAGLITAAYHYLRNPNEGTSVAQQVQASLEVMGDKRRPMWLDCETKAGLSVDHIREFKQRFEAAGVHVIGAYSYVPWWEGKVAGGEPDSHEFGAFWVAAYGTNPSGAPSAIYPGDNHHQWDYPLGNQKPALWQFGSNAQVAGYSVDINAYRGTEDELRALFTGTKKEDFLMALSDDEQRRLLENTDYLRGQFGPHERLGYNDHGQPLTFIDWAKTQAVKLDYVFGQLRPWSQLGKDAQGRDLTLVDANAAQRYDLATLAQKVTDLIAQLKEKK